MSGLSVPDMLLCARFKTVKRGEYHRLLSILLNWLWSRSKVIRESCLMDPLIVPVNLVEGKTRQYKFSVVSENQHLLPGSSNLYCKLLAMQQCADSNATTDH